MRQITLSLREETVASLQRDFETFLRLSLKLDPHFITPSFEDFLRAKLLDNPTPLTEQGGAAHAHARPVRVGQAHAQ